MGIAGFQTSIFNRIMIATILLFCFFSPCSQLSAQKQSNPLENMESANTLLFSENSRIDSVLATVNGIPVTLLDVILESAQTERALASIYSGERLYTETLKVRREVLDEILFRHMVYAQYQKKPFEIPQQAVENLLEGLMANVGILDRKKFEKQAENYGISMQELRQKAQEKLVVDIMLSQFCDRQVYVTPKQVYEEYEEHPEEWNVPAQIRLQLIQLKYSGSRAGENTEESVSKVQEMLKDADSIRFLQVAKEFSDAPSADSSADNAPLTETRSLRPEFREAVSGLEVGDIAGPIRTPEAVYFLRIAEIRKSYRKPFSVVCPEIREKLRNAAVAKKRQEYRKELEADAVIRYYF